MTEMDFENRMREHGFRITPQRSVIIRAIWDNGEHATIEDILAAVKQNAPDVSPATVYRTIDLFIKHHFVIATMVGNQTVYEIVSEHPHYHLICEQCGWDQRVELKKVRTIIQDIKNEFNFRVEPEHMILTGLCAHCQESAGK